MIFMGWPGQHELEDDRAAHRSHDANGVTGSGVLQPAPGSSNLIHIEFPEHLIICQESCAGMCSVIWVKSKSDGTRYHKYLRICVVLEVGMVPSHVGRTRHCE